MKINLTTITEEEWKILFYIKRISVGCFNNIKETASELAKHCSWIKNIGINSIYRESIQWISWYFTCCVGSYAGIYDYLGAYRLLDGSLDLWLQQSFLWEDQSAWYHVVPKNYQRTVQSWWRQFLYGANDFAFWHNNENLLAYYGLLYHLDHAQIEDINQLWGESQKLYDQLLTTLNGLLSNSWYWHWVLRECVQTSVKTIQKEREELLNRLRQKLLLRENNLAVAKLLIEDGFYQGLFSMVLKKIDIEKIVESWQLYYPEWFEVYQILSQQGLTVNVNNFWALYVKQSLKDAKESGYCYGRLIERWLAKEEAFAIKAIDDLFFKTASSYSEFWHQFKDVVIFQERSAVLQAINQNLAIWLYSEEGIKGLHLDQIVFAKVPFHIYPTLLKRYNIKMDDDTVKRCKIITEDLSYQMRVEQSFSQKQETQVIWQSLDLVINLPVFNQNYMDRLIQCVSTHHCLGGEVAKNIQAYMITVGRYKWLSKWHISEVQQLIQGMKSIESDVWKKGVSIIEDEIQIQQIKGSRCV